MTEEAIRAALALLLLRSRRAECSLVERVTYGVARAVQAQYSRQEVPSPVVHVTVPSAPPPVVNVTVPDGAITVRPEISITTPPPVVNLPPHEPVDRVIERNHQGEIVRIREVPKG